MQWAKSILQAHQAGTRREVVQCVGKGGQTCQGWCAKNGADHQNAQRFGKRLSAETRQIDGAVAQAVMVMGCDGFARQLLWLTHQRRHGEGGASYPPESSND